MKNDCIIYLTVLIALTFLGFKAYQEEVNQIDSVKQSVLTDDDIQTLLLDSAILRKQAELIQKDSVMTVYLLNQLELKTNIGLLMIENLKRHQVLNEESYQYAKNQMNKYHYIDCCL